MDLKQQKKEQKKWDSVWKFQKQRHLSKVLTLDAAHHWFFRIIKKEAGQIKGRKILEAGSGSGITSLALAKAGAHVTLLEISSEALGFSRKLFSQRKVFGKFVEGSIFKIPFANQTFDIVFNQGVLEHFDFDSQVKALAEMHRVLKNGGKVITINPSPHGLIYQKALNYTQTRNLYPYGFEKPIDSLKYQYNKLTEAKLIKEQRTGWALQFQFLKYFFIKNKVLYYSIAALSESLCWLLYLLNFIPGFQLVTVSTKLKNPS